MGNSTHVDGELLVFYLPERSPGQLHRKFRKRIYGEPTSSQQGKYRYRRQGLLDDLPHVKLYKGVLIVRKEDGDKVVGGVEEFGAQVRRRIVRLTEADLEALGLG